MTDWINRFDQIKNKVKTQLNAKGVDNINQLRGIFHEYDRDNSGTLSRLEFEEFLTKLGIFLKKQELTTVYNSFDTNKDGHINYEEFVNTLRTDMVDKRLAVVKHAWQIISRGAQTVSFSTLQENYNANAHPRVRTREKKSETVRADFAVLMGSRHKNGEICENSWIQYYADINSCLQAEKDDYFVDLVLSTWGLNSDKAFVSEARLRQLEDIVFEKVRQRTHGADDEGKTVRKIFRHFDLDGFGTIELSEFKQSLETLGCVFKAPEIEALFNKYDANGNGKLDYEEFANAFALKGSGNNPNVNPVFSQEREKPNQVLDKVKKVLLKRGQHGIRGLGLIFRKMDNNGDKKLDRYEFQWGLKENGHDITPSEFERIFKYFDKTNNGKIDYNEFLVALRGDLNARRQRLVDAAFDKLDTSGNGAVSIGEMVDAYQVEFHNKFKSGEMSKRDILNDFMNQWENAAKDGKIERWEFRDYYRDVSASIDEDDLFELTIRNAWHLAGGDSRIANTTIANELVIGKKSWAGAF